MILGDTQIKHGALFVVREDDINKFTLAIANHALSDSEQAELVSRLSVVFSNCDISLRDNSVEAILHKSVEPSSFKLALNDQLIRLKYARRTADLRNLLFAQLLR